MKKEELSNEELIEIVFQDCLSPKCKTCPFAHSDEDYGVAIKNELLRRLNANAAGNPVNASAEEEKTVLSEVKWVGKEDIKLRLKNSFWVEDLSEEALDFLAKAISDTVDWDYVAELGIVAGNEFLDGLIGDSYAGGGD